MILQNLILFKYNICLDIMILNKNLPDKSTFDTIIKFFEIVHLIMLLVIPFKLLIQDFDFCLV